MQAEDFLLHYGKDEIRHGVLWENHCHAHFELIAVLTGDVCISLEGKEYRLGADNAIIIPPLCYHTVTANKKCTYLRLTASFDEGAIPPVLRALFQKSEPQPFATEPGQAQRLRAILQEEDRALYLPLLHSLMIQLLYTCVGSIRADSVGTADPLLHRALLYIERHLCENPSLDEIAACIPCSKSFFCHRFQEKMRISPKQYILQKRMALAAKLIREGTPPTEASLRVGYENYISFYRMYQKHLHKIPSEE